MLSPALALLVTLRACPAWGTIPLGACQRYAAAVERCATCLAVTPGCHLTPQHIASLYPPPFCSDLSELDLPQQVTLSFPHGLEHSQWFEVAMTPGEEQVAMP